MGDARAAALRALLRVDVDEGYSNLVLEHEWKELDREDRTFAAALFYGVLERRITLDYGIGCFSKLPVKKLSPKVRELLRMGVYQILYLDSVPPHAAVNETVALAKRCGEGRASGFVNAVLRSLLRSGGHFPLPDPDRDPLRNLSVRFSCPEWLIGLWQEAYGRERTLLLLDSLLKRPQVYARVNNTRVTEEKIMESLAEEGIRSRPAECLKDAIILENPGSVADSACFREGLFHVQDLSSQICCSLLGARPGESVIDVCSAPGGKAFTLAERMENRGSLLAFDKTEARAGLIREGAARLGLDIVRAGVRDAAHPAAPLEPADRVLCDVPCSGLGVLRRKPEIRYKLQSALDSLPDLQYLILCRSSELVKKRGIIIYSTCTLNPKENSDVADRFLTCSPEFEPLPLQLPKEIVRSIEEPENQLTLMPYANGSDGFFISAFRRR